MAETTTRPQTKPGTIVHTELVSNDVDASKDFMANTFGWAYEEVPMPGMEGATYSMWKVGDQVYGAITGPGPDNMPPQTLNYLGVESVDEKAKEIEANGGKVLMEPTQVGAFGRMCIFQIPGGTVLACWEANEP